MENNNLLLILGNQLFPIEYIKAVDCKKIFMKEDLGLCTDFKHHKLKILFFFTAMREYKDYLISNGFEVTYFYASDDEFNSDYIKTLNNYILENRITKINYFEIEDNNFNEKVSKFISKKRLKFLEHQTPMFLNSRKEFNDLAKNNSLKMSSFYQSSRKKFKILVCDKNKPVGGKWSFDSENRKKLPKNIPIPKLCNFYKSKYSNILVKYISEKFHNHPGKLDNIWFPTNRRDALILLEDFLKTKFNNFGTYEDAIQSNNNFLFHSLLSPLLNIGLITPKEVVKKSLEYAKKNSIPLNCIEGFIRQIIGWREFIRGVYHLRGKQQEQMNFFKHTRKLSKSWYDGTTGILPLDDAIKNCIQYGYTHHIPRLMIISNIMTLSGIHPQEIYKWFMEMFIDSSEWVMVPNVFGMGTFADGGVFSTKPYSCSSNYILKMSDYKKSSWCKVVDALYWKFISDNRSFFEKNPRLSIIPRFLDKMDSEKKNLLFKDAENFILAKTL